MEKSSTFQKCNKKCHNFSQCLEPVEIMVFDRMVFWSKTFVARLSNREYSVSQSSQRVNK